jgi:hypothetical protein
MAIRQIKHRLGNIEYEYNDQIPWTATDQKMVDGLAHCFLVSDKSMEDADAVLKRSMKVSKSVKEGNEFFKKVAEVLKQAQLVAGGYVGAIELGQLSIANALAEATNLANDAFQKQSEVLTAAHAEYSAVLDSRNKLVDEAEEDNAEVYNQLTGLFKLGYEAENIATDLMSFDQASERAREVLSFNDRAQERKLDAVISTTCDFELLLAKVEGQQNVWTEFGSRMILIEYIGKIRSGNQSTSFN